MQDLYFSLPANLIVRITSNDKLLLNDFSYLLARAYIPGLERIKISTKHRADIIIEHKESKKKRMVSRGNRIVIHDQWNRKIPLDLYHILYSAARLSLLKNNLYTVHAACTGNGKYILIVGHSGVGKTSILLQLINKKEKQIFSGNKTVISFGKAGRLNAVAGTPTITIAANVARNKKVDIQEVMTYYGRTAFLLDKKYYTPKELVPIQAIAVVKLNDGVREFSKFEPLSALHALYPYFLDKVNADTIMCDGNSLFIGMPSASIEEKLVTSLRSVLFKIPSYTITGSLPFVVNKISKL